MGPVETASGIGEFEAFDTVQSLTLPAVGIVMVVQLLLFSGAVARLPLATVGMLQYIAATALLIFRYFVFDEAMSAGRWIGFILV